LCRLSLLQDVSTDFYRHFAYNYGALESSFFANYYSLLGSTRSLRINPHIRHLILLDPRRGTSP